MKNPNDPRHLYRMKLMQSIFATDFQGDIEDDKSLQKDLKRIKKLQEKLDEIISSSAVEWPIQEINKVDLAILRISVYELVEKSTPAKVVIDEAIELAKEFGAENSAKFVNGVLATVVAQREKDNGNRTNTIQA